MANTNVNALKEQVIENAAMQQVENANNSQVINAHEEFVKKNLSAFSGKQEDLCSTSKSGLLKARQAHNEFNGLFLDTVNGQSNKNYKEFLLMPAIKNDSRMECDHVRVAVQKDGKIEDIFYLLCQFKPRTDKYVTYDEAGLRSAITKKYSTKHRVIVLGYQYNGTFVKCTDIENVAFTEIRDLPVYEEKAAEDGTIERTYKYVIDGEKGTRKIKTESVEQTLVPVLTNKVQPSKFTAALNRAIAKNWLLLFGADTKAEEPTTPATDTQEKPSQKKAPRTKKGGAKKGQKKQSKKSK